MMAHLRFEGSVEMTTVKRITDLSSYAAVLPYASEMFGVYQPLLGWRSKRIQQRLHAGYANDRRQLLETLQRKFAPLIQVAYGDGQQVKIDLEPGCWREGSCVASTASCC